jgi:hypothetical protein
LVGEPRLDDGIGAIAVRHGVRRRLDLLQKTQCCEIGDDALPRLEAVEPAIGRRRVVVELRVVVEHVDLLE